MVLEQLTCPQCGAEVHLREGATVVHCEYCGTDSLLETLTAQGGEEARAPARARRVPGAPRVVLFGAILGGLLVTAIALFVGVIGSQTAKHNAQGARALRYQSDMSEIMGRLRDVQMRMTDASKRRDDDALRRAQAELPRIQEELSRREQEYLQGR